MNWRDVPIPERMKHLPRDKRGFPIFVVAFLDRDGEPVFTMNDPAKLHRCAEHQLCMICGSKLFRGRWLVGGPMSAFDPNGVYADGPMHHDCMNYAMRVCPYLATPNYTKDLASLTAVKMAAKGIPAIATATLPGQPPVFVAGMCDRIELIRRPFDGLHFRPKRPFMRVLYWRGGATIPEAEAAKLIAPYVERRKTETMTDTVVHFGSAQ